MINHYLEGCSTVNGGLVRPVVTPTFQCPSAFILGICRPWYVRYLRHTREVEAVVAAEVPFWTAIAGIYAAATAAGSRRIILNGSLAFESHCLNDVNDS